MSLTIIRTSRDILLVPLRDRNFLTVSCDAAGGVGPKTCDRVHVDGRTLGRFTARVALMETIAIGARPKCISATIPLERGRISSDILTGVRREVSLLDHGIPIVSSTENNFTVKQSGLGVTVIGIVNRASMRLGKSRRDDVVLSIGYPFVGRGVVSADNQGLIADLNDVIRLTRLPFVHEIIPVGSRGISHETATLAKDSHLRFIGGTLSKIDSRQSAGPGTVVLCSTPTERIQDLMKFIQKPMNVVGVFY